MLGPTARRDHFHLTLLEIFGHDRGTSHLSNCEGLLTISDNAITVLSSFDLFNEIVLLGRVGVVTVDCRVAACTRLKRRCSSLLLT